MNTFLNMADWEKVNLISGVDEIKQDVLAGLPNLGNVSTTGRRSTYSGFDDNEICNEARFRLLRTLKSYIWEGYENG